MWSGVVSAPEHRHACLLRGGRGGQGGGPGLHGTPQPQESQPGPTTCLPTCCGEPRFRTTSDLSMRKGTLSLLQGWHHPTSPRCTWWEGHCSLDRDTWLPALCQVTSRASGLTTMRPKCRPNTLEGERPKSAQRLLDPRGKAVGSAPQAAPCPPPVRGAAVATAASLLLKGHSPTRQVVQQLWAPFTGEKTEAPIQKV